MSIDDLVRFSATCATFWNERSLLETISFKCVANSENVRASHVRGLCARAGSHLRCLDLRTLTVEACRSSLVGLAHPQLQILRIDEKCIVYTEIYSSLVASLPSLVEFHGRVHMSKIPRGLKLFSGTTLSTANNQTRESLSNMHEVFSLYPDTLRGIVMQGHGDGRAEIFKTLVHQQKLEFMAIDVMSEEPTRGSLVKFLETSPMKELHLYSFHRGGEVLQTLFVGLARSSLLLFTISTSLSWNDMYAEPLAALCRKVETVYCNFGVSEASDHTRQILGDRCNFLVSDSEWHRGCMIIETKH